MLTSLTRNTVVLLVLTYLGSAYLSPPTLAGPAEFEAQRPANTGTGSRTAVRALLDE